MRGEVRPGRCEGVGWRRRKRHARGGNDSRLEVGARAERTRNMRYMFVTLEVSQLDMIALKLRNLVKRLLVSVMAETSQSAMGPCVAMASVGLSLYN